jgi:hypothetical protein
VLAEVGPRLRLILGEHDITMQTGEVAEFTTRLPHWFGPAGEDPVEILSVHGSHGQRMHVRAAPDGEQFPETATTLGALPTERSTSAETDRTPTVVFVSKDRQSHVASDRSTGAERRVACH